MIPSLETWSCGQSIKPHIRVLEVRHRHRPNAIDSLFHDECFIMYLETRTGDKNRHLFKSQGGGFYANTIQQRFATLYRRAGIKGASSHSGRRTFVTRLCEAGLDIKSISVLMRHKNVSTTAKYIQENPMKLARAVEDL